MNEFFSYIHTYILFKAHLSPHRLPLALAMSFLLTFTDEAVLEELGTFYWGSVWVKFRFFDHLFLCNLLVSGFITSPR
jgi:hypothetical protein